MKKVQKAPLQKEKNLNRKPSGKTEVYTKNIGLGRCFLYLFGKKFVKYVETSCVTT